MAKVASAFLFLLSITVSSASSAERGVEGLQSEHVMVAETQKIRMIHGRVTDEVDSPLGDVRIEILTDPDVLLQPYSTAMNERYERRRRLAEYWTKKDGKFRFSRIPPGRYELRFQKSGFNLLSLIIEIVSPETKIKSSAIQAVMPLAH